MPILSLAVLIIAAGLLALLVLLLRLAAGTSRPRLVGELLAVALLLGALGWGFATFSQRVPQ